MLKILSQNEKINRRMVPKEKHQFFYKFFLCALILSKKIRTSKKRERKNSSKKQIPKLILSKKDVVLSHLHRYYVNWQSKLSFRSPFTKAQTICFLTGRSRSIYRAFRLSRLKIREYGATGYFVGLSKASW